jgi:cytidine deaminase
VSTYPRLAPDLVALLRQARTATHRAYAPYSRFRVGAAVRTRNGGTYTGCNVENASYGLTLCAERSAVAAAVAAEGARMRVVALAVAVAGANSAPFPPCGACRQVMAEFAAPDSPVLYAGARGAPVVSTIGALLPEAFRLS